MGWTATSSEYGGVRQWLEVALEAQATGEPAEIPPDFAAWCAYLGWLNACLSAGVLVPGQLNKDEANGLVQLDQVTRELWQSLQRCAKCGAMQRASLTCRRCGKGMSSAERGAAGTGR